MVSGGSSLLAADDAVLYGGPPERLWDLETAFSSVRSYVETRGSHIRCRLYLDFVVWDRGLPNNGTETYHYENSTDSLGFFLISS